MKSELEVEDNSLPSNDLTGHFDMGIRRRSNTAQRLEKMRQEKKVQSKTKNINWKSPTQIASVSQEGNTIKYKRVVLNADTLSPDEIALLEYNETENLYYETEAYRNYLFPVCQSANTSQQSDRIETSESTNPSSAQKRKSVLSAMIERCPDAPVNPFNAYTRFDARVSEDKVSKKRIKIFFKINEDDKEFMAADFSKKVPPSSRMVCGVKWIEIICLANTRICDLIGLICWHYTHLQLGPPLKPDVNMYALKMSEETGDIDSDFPNLTASDEIKRYGFPYLALVEVETHITVTV